MRIALFPTCVVDAVAPDVGMATARVLEARGHEVVVPEAATCCGQPAWNAGHTPPAHQVAAATLDALDACEADVIVVPAGSCTTMLRVFWAELFAAHGTAEQRRRVAAVTSRVRELSEFLSESSDALAPAGPPDDGTDAPASTRPGDPVVYHRSCHMLRELRIRETPERLLDEHGVSRVPTAAEGRCCGFGGTFSVGLPETSVAMADEVLDAAVAAGAGRVVGCDTSCLVHLESRARRRGLALTFSHLAEELDVSTTDRAT